MHVERRPPPVRAPLFRSPSELACPALPDPRPGWSDGIAASERVRAAVSGAVAPCIRRGDQVSALGSVTADERPHDEEPSR